ncbi:LytTR family DNA-binding domain-containing protein [Dysosmobacter sp.]|uniref:LytTR family DNA-binding domain-containing protein n=1 Tax=Dysosmobacter sp. TaxID=2591382 RepID=UPI003A941319
MLAQTDRGTYTVRQRLYELEQKFLVHRFARISHSEIVNLKKVTALDLTLTGTIRVTLSDGTVCWASRRYVRRIKEVLGL